MLNVITGFILNGQLGSILHITFVVSFHLYAHPELSSL